jgi:hypothetical protein
VPDLQSNLLYTWGYLKEERERQKGKRKMERKKKERQKNERKETTDGRQQGTPKGLQHKRRLFHKHVH